MTPDNRDREPLPGAPGGEIDDGWGPWRTDISEWNVSTHDVRFECVGGIHKISTRPRTDLIPRPAEPAQVAHRATFDALLADATTMWSRRCDAATARAEAAETALAAMTAREGADADLLLAAYKGMLVLHRMCDKSGLAAGAAAAENIADQIVAAHPEMPGRASLRAALQHKDANNG